MYCSTFCQLSICFMINWQTIKRRPVSLKLLFFSLTPLIALGQCWALRRWRTYTTWDNYIAFCSFLNIHIGISDLDFKRVTVGQTGQQSSLGSSGEKKMFILIHIFSCLIIIWVRQGTSCPCVICNWWLPRSYVTLNDL